jgi:hypothetical protein
MIFYLIHHHILVQSCMKAVEVHDYICNGAGNNNKYPLYLSVSLGPQVGSAIPLLDHFQSVY